MFHLPTPSHNCPQHTAGTARTLTPALLCLAALLATQAAAQSAPPAPPAPQQTEAAAEAWELQSVPGSAASYVRLDDIRSVYKFAPDTLDRRNGTRSVGNGTTTLIFGPEPHELTIHGVRCRLSHPTITNARGEFLISLTDVVKLIDPVLRPTYITKRREVKTIIIDPGHGGQDVGHQTPQVREADFTLSLARMLATQLTQRGYDVRLTRQDNCNLSNQLRIDHANEAENAIFLSLHLNSGRSDLHGIETYTVTPYAPPTATEAESPSAAPEAAPATTDSLLQAGNMGVMPGNEQDCANIALAFALQSSLVHATGAQDGGCRRARYSLLSSVRCPAAIVELGYATHEQEGAALNTEEYRALLASALANGVDTFARALKPGAKPPVTAAPPPPPPPTPVKVDKPAPDTKKADSSKKKATQGKKTIRKSKGRTNSNRKRGSSKRTGRKR